MRKSAFMVIGAACVVAAGLVAPGPPATGGGIDEAREDLSIDTSNCAGPASTPACASRTWRLCPYRRAPALCAAVGVENVVFFDRYEFDENGDLIYPEGAEGRLLFSSSLATHDLIAVREVGPECFQTNFVDEVSEEEMGTHEVMLGHELYRSEFYRRDDDRWVLVSWTDGGGDCHFQHDFVRVDCNMRVYIDSWLDLHNRGGRWRVPGFDQ